MSQKITIPLKVLDIKLFSNEIKTKIQITFIFSFGIQIENLLNILTTE